MKALYPIFMILLGAVQPSASAVELVSAETIKTQKALTQVHKLSNGIPVILRKENSSKIVQFLVGFKGGMGQSKPGDQTLGRWMFPIMTKAAKGYTRDQVFALKEKYSFSLGCGSSLDMSQCSLSTINDYWQTGLDLLAASVKSPSFDKVDAELARQRLEARLKNTPRSPDAMVNETVNKIFYPEDSPYFTTHQEALKQLAAYKQADLRRLHAEILNATRMQIVVVSSLDKAELLPALEKAFGKIAKRPIKHRINPAPTYSSRSNYKFQERDVATAYVLAKVNAPNFVAEEAAASKLMYQILSDKMALEIRTKRSLSYAAHAFTLQFDIGMSGIYMSTSKPEESIKVFSEIVADMQNNPLSKEILEEYKRKNATKYYLTQETHSSIAGAIAEWHMRTGSTDGLYEWPKKLSKVSPKDIQQQAKQQLQNFRVGILAKKDEFDKAWLKPLGV